MATPNMGLDLPVENGDAGTWDTKINDAMDVIDAHDHTPGNGSAIPLSALTPDADLSLANGSARYAIINAKALDFEPQTTTAVTGYSGAIFVNDADNELYWRNTSGVNVKLTSGSSINAAALGAIGGDYGTAGAEVAYVDASDAYTFKQQTGGGVRQYARLHCGGVDLYEFKAHPTAGVPTSRVRLESPAALAASYAITMPAALPGLTSFVYMSSTGALTVSSDSNAINAVAVTLACTTATITSATIGGATHDSSGIVLATNDHVTVSGTGDFKHGDRIRLAAPADAYVATNFATGTDCEKISSGAGSFRVSIPFDAGDRIKSVAIKAIGNGTVDGTVGYLAFGADTTLSFGSTAITNAAVAVVTYTHAAINYTMIDHSMFVVEVTANAAGLEVYTIAVTYDRP